MLELAVTQDGNFLRFTRNARAIGLPDGSTVLGPLAPAGLPLTVGVYTIRAVVAEVPPSGDDGMTGQEPPVVDGDVVVLRRSVACPIPVAEEGRP